jgi:exosome complex component RRP42
MNDDGNLLDAAALAAVVALKNAVLPKYDEKEEKVLYKELTKKKLDMSKLPVLVTFAKNASYIFIDPDRKEENVLDTRLSVSSLADGKIVALQKGGQGTFTKEEILNIFDLAVERAKEHRKLIK